MKTIKIGGVPEHFNLPWHLAIEKGKFAKKGIDLQWQDFLGGTGAMCNALRDGSIDAAIVLTEGIVKDIIAGNPSKIVKVYVASPLLWGIHVSATSNFQKVDELDGAKVAISRPGSGSQLMALVNAHQHNFDKIKLNYKIVKNLDGGIDALTKGTADYFMWEHFTTKPYVDNGIFRRIDSITTPWPCFVLAVRNEVLNNDEKLIKKLIKVINKQLKPFNSPFKSKKLLRIFEERYHQQSEDIKTWLSITKWDRKKYVSEKLINNIQNKLVTFSVIEESVQAKMLSKKIN